MPLFTDMYCQAYRIRGQSERAVQNPHSAKWLDCAQKRLFWSVISQAQARYRHPRMKTQLFLLINRIRCQALGRQHKHIIQIMHVHQFIDTLVAARDIIYAIVRA